MSPHCRLADPLSFIPILDLLFPVSPVPFLTWLSHLFENILQEFLEKGCGGGTFFETLEFGWGEKSSRQEMIAKQNGEG